MDMNNECGYEYLRFVKKKNKSNINMECINTNKLIKKLDEFFDFFFKFKTIKINKPTNDVKR